MAEYTMSPELKGMIPMLEQMEASDWFASAPEWAHFDISNALNDLADFHKGNRDSVVYSEGKLRHLQSCINCVQSVNFRINGKIERDLAWAERNKVVVAEVKTRKRTRKLTAKHLADREKAAKKGAKK